MFYNSGSQRSKQSGSSESSSDSDAGPPPPNPYTQCRICGEFHDEINCPYLTMNMGGDFPDQGSDQPRPGDAEVGTMQRRRIIPLEQNPSMIWFFRTLLIMPVKLEDMSIRSSWPSVSYRKPPGNEVYQWAQECMTSTENQLKNRSTLPTHGSRNRLKANKNLPTGSIWLNFSANG